MIINKLKTILLVEDNSRDVELFLEALEEYHLANQVVVLKDGVEAIEYLQLKGKYETRGTENPVVIFMDLKMPSMDGIDTLKVVKSDEKLRLIPVVMLTS